MNERLERYQGMLEATALSQNELDIQLEHAKKLFELVNNPFIKREIAKKDPLHAVVSETPICDLVDNTTGGEDRLWVQVYTNKREAEAIIFRKRIIRGDQAFLEEVRDLYFPSPDILVRIDDLVEDSFPGFRLQTTDYEILDDSEGGKFTVCIVQHLKTPEDIARLYGSQIDTVIVPGIENLLISQKE